jgi:hypothetical protein
MVGQRQMLRLLAPTPNSPNTTVMRSSSSFIFATSSLAMNSLVMMPRLLNFCTCPQSECQAHGGGGGVPQGGRTSHGVCVPQGQQRAQGQSTLGEVSGGPHWVRCEVVHTG